MSDSVQPHRRQPTRLPRPWDSPGKNTGVGCHFLLQCMKVKGGNEVTQSCTTLSDPMDCSLPGLSIHGIFQARVLEWGAIAFSTIMLYQAPKGTTMKQFKRQTDLESTVPGAGDAYASGAAQPPKRHVHRVLSVLTACHSFAIKELSKD